METKNIWWPCYFGEKHTHSQGNWGGTYRNHLWGTNKSFSGTEMFGKKNIWWLKYPVENPCLSRLRCTGDPLHKKCTGGPCLSKTHKPCYLQGTNKEHHLSQVPWCMLAWGGWGACLKCLLHHHHHHHPEVNQDNKNETCFKPSNYSLTQNEVPFWKPHTIGHVQTNFWATKPQRQLFLLMDLVTKWRANGKPLALFPDCMEAHVAKSSTAAVSTNIA